MEDIRRRRCKLGESRGLATVWCPDTCARLSQLPPNVDFLWRSDVCWIHDLIKPAKERQQVAVLNYQSGAHLGTLILARWSDAAFRDQIRGMRAADWVISLPFFPRLSGAPATFRDGRRIPR